MFIRKIIILLIISDLLFSGNQDIVAQSAPQTTVEKQVHSVLDNFLIGDSFQKFKTKHYKDAKGELVVDLVVKGRKVETIFVDSSTITSPQFENAFCNFIKDMAFDFKLKKGERQKIRHQFIIL